MTLLAAAQTVADTMTGNNPVLTPVASGEPEMNLWDMACKGGWIMIVLALMSVIAFYIFFERAVAIRKAGKEDPLFMDPYPRLYQDWRNQIGNQLLPYNQYSFFAYD